MPAGLKTKTQDFGQMERPYFFVYKEEIGRMLVTKMKNRAQIRQ